MPRPLELMVPEGFEQVAYGHDAATGLRAIVALHSTVLGPGLGGTRFYPFPDEEAALVDVCRLAKGMTYKHAAAGLDQGGGKAVIIGDPATLRSDELIRAYARFVDGLAGRYVTAEDVGTTQADMDLIRTITPHVSGISEHLGGSGDPSPATALGVLWAMKAVAERLWGDAVARGPPRRHQRGRQGGRRAGRPPPRRGRPAHGGRRAARRRRRGRRAHGCRRWWRPSGAHAVACDLYSPCALGGALSATTIPELRTAAVVGCANNQLATPQDAQRIADSGVLYAPDYVVNAGGVINIAEEKGGYDRARAEERIRGIHDTVLRVLDLAAAEGITTAAAADLLAERRIDAARMRA